MKNLGMEHQASKVWKRDDITKEVIVEIREIELQKGNGKVRVISCSSGIFRIDNTSFPTL